MLMKLEKDRLIAKLENLEGSLRQIIEQEEEENKDDVSKKMDVASKKSKVTTQVPTADPKATTKTKMVVQPSQIPPKDRPNPFLNETFEPVNSRMSL